MALVNWGMKVENSISQTLTLCASAWNKIILLLSNTQFIYYQIRLKSKINPGNKSSPVNV